MPCSTPFIKAGDISLQTSLMFFGAIPLSLKKVRSLEFSSYSYGLGHSKSLAFTHFILLELKNVVYLEKKRIKKIIY